MCIKEVRIGEIVFWEYANFPETCTFTTLVKRIRDFNNKKHVIWKHY